MNGALPLRNPIRHYAWGSRTELARLAGRPAPTAEPEAELWMGAHPSAPSDVLLEGAWRSLVEVIEARPRAVLGSEVEARFGASLPFLFKVLAVAEPLSIQAHPDADQARDGFERENAAGVPLDSAERCYRDPRAKPELVCALTRFQALCGFRPPVEIARALDRLAVPGLARERAALEQASESDALRDFLAGLLGRAAPEAHEIAHAAAHAAALEAEIDPASAWIVQLERAHPGDPGVLAPLFLRYFELAPGEALFLEPGELHCYLEGTGVELMANSDNVLRGGLTSKHVAVDELMHVLRFGARRDARWDPIEHPSGERRFAPPVAEFSLGLIALGSDTPFQSPMPRSVEILLCVEGHASVALEEGILALKSGDSCLVPAAAGAYELRGDGAVFRATAGEKLG